MTPFREIRSLGIMGGTFDPIHYGHLVTAEAARCTFGLERVLFVPSFRPPHKPDREISDKEHRYLMTVLATVTNPYFGVSRVEIDRPGFSYTVDTLRELRRQYPGTELFFVTGADAILEICTWQDPPALLKMCHFIAATRPGYPLNGLKRLERELGKGVKQRIHRFEVPALAISSTDIRDRVRHGRPIKYLVPESVEHYIYKHGLYRHDGEPREKDQPGANHTRQRNRCDHV